jgi:hypothetical protein
MYVLFPKRLCITATNSGRAQTCIGLLNSKFPDSPRVDCLKGIKVEVTEGSATALKFYETLLEADPSNAVRIGVGTAARTLLIWLMARRRSGNASLPSIARKET